ncbi:hypothetical protein H7100_02290 [Candidatus Saccharibacteria bacterium]|nr:hypothetical protein [Candidatus Saccharibacteria bacterium]
MTEFHIKMIELPAPKDEYESSYGVVTENAPIAELTEMIHRLHAEAIAMNGLVQQLGIAPLEEITAYAPARLLTEVPSDQQVKQYNNDHTQSVAAYVVAIQQELETVPIAESDERFVYLPDIFKDHDVAVEFSESTFHEACGKWAGKPREYWARESFATRLVVMGALLNTQRNALFFEDAFRPVGVQEGLFKRRVAWTRADHPDWTNDQIIQEAKSKTAVKPRLASHKAGAAVDARLKDLETGNILDFGHNYPDGGALVFPQTTFITKEQWLNRQRFQIAAGLSGLMLYVGEDWHISYGDNLASLAPDGHVDKNYVAKYGPIKDFDRQTGEISQHYIGNEIDTTFDF